MSNFSLLHADTQFSQDHLLKKLTFPHEWFWHPCWKSFDYGCEGLFLGSSFYSIGLYAYLCTRPYCFDYYYFVTWLELRKCDASNLFCFLRIALTIQSPCGSIWILGFVFHFWKKCCWNFDRACIESKDCFGHCGHFNIHIKFFKP